MERADEALLPAVYKEVGAALHATPLGLGSLTLLRSIAQPSLCLHYNSKGVEEEQRVGMGEERRTLVLVNLAGIMERADEALLPAVYKEVGAALHATPLGLGSLTLLRSIVQATCYPLSTYMAVRYNRTHVIALGAFLWAAATFLVALSNTFLQVAISRALNGIGLALVVPAIQSLVADSTDESARGIAFGWLQLTEIVPERSRTSIYALDRSFESILASFAPPVVGMLAEHVYGYRPVSDGSGEGATVEIDRENAASLAKALYTAIAIPMSLCCSIYSFLYHTYPRDRERARMESLIASELQHIELENPPRVGDYSQIQLSEPDFYTQEPIVLDMVYGEENFETDENGRKKLLYDDVVLSDVRG
ncbi:hypothetical protein COCNU_scaffold001054G000120 [Cocos nucifera]|nr:hypothetical protein [Cocos nucifera]